MTEDAQSYYDKLTPHDQQACLSDIAIYGTYAIQLVDGVAKRVPPHEIYKMVEGKGNAPS